MTNLKKYPLTIRCEYYRENSDRRDYSNLSYVTETKVDSFDEEIKYYEGMNHEANVEIILL